MTTTSHNGIAPDTERSGATSALALALPRADATARTGVVSLVIPTKNEARNLPWVLGQVPDCVHEIVLVDASVDATRTMARACRPDVIVVDQHGPGKGNALRAGFAACAGDLIVMMDADGSMSPAEIPHFVHFLRNGYDFVKGSRFMGGGGSLDITRLRQAGNWGLLMMVNLLYHANLTDLCYGYCAFDRRFLEHLDLTAEGFDIEAQMTIHALKAGLRIAEVPSLELPRRSGRSNLHAFADGRTVLRTILNDRRSNSFVFPAIQSIGAAPNEGGLADHP